MTQPGFLNDPALGRIWDALPEARVVGGAVRDALAGRDVADIDLATPRDPAGVMAALRHAGVKVVPTGLAHGTVTAVVEGRGFEITTLRSDVETDGRHAVVAFTTDWQLDASRRDFTINAMSMARDGSVCDYFGGEDDLRAGRVRFVGDPATRIAEDYLRILRFFRFYARYGQEPPDAATLRALRDGIPGLARLSVERVWTELRRILSAPDPVAAVELMEQLGIWTAVLPEAPAVHRLRGVPSDPVLRLAALLIGDALLADAPPRNVHSGDASSGDAPSGNVLSGDALVRNALPQNAPPGSASGGNASPGSALPGPAVARGVLPGNASPGNALPATAVAVAARLKLSNQDRDRLIRLLATPSPGGTDADLRRLLADHLPSDLIDRTWLDGTTDVRRRLSGMGRPVFPLEGRDVLAAGIPPGPRIGMLLRDVRQWWLDGGCVADRGACLAELARAVKKSAQVTAKR